MARVWFRALLCGVCLCFVLGCGDDGDNAGSKPEEGGCACQGGSCEPGVCVIQIKMGEGCEAWGEANVFVGDLSAEAEPLGTVSAGGTFTTCQGFGAPIVLEDGSQDPESQAETFRFLIESEDKRQVTPTVEQACADSAPFVYSIDCS